MASAIVGGPPRRRLRASEGAECGQGERCREQSRTQCEALRGSPPSTAAPRSREPGARGVPVSGALGEVTSRIHRVESWYTHLEGLCGTVYPPTLEIACPLPRSPPRVAPLLKAVDGHATNGFDRGERRQGLNQAVGAGCHQQRRSTHSGGCQCLGLIALLLALHLASGLVEDQFKVFVGRVERSALSC